LLEHTALGVLRVQAEERRQLLELQGKSLEKERQMKLDAARKGLAAAANAPGEPLGTSMKGFVKPLEGGGKDRRPYGMFDIENNFSDDTRLRVKGQDASAAADADAASSQAAQLESTEKRLQRMEHELAEMRRTLEEMQTAFANAEAQASEAANRKSEATAALGEAAKLTPELEQDYVDWKTAVNMATSTEKSPAQAKAELEEQIAQLEARARELQEEWERTRRPMLAQLAEREKHVERRRQVAERQLQAIKQMREEMRQMLVTAREREEQYKSLLAEYESASKVVQRSTFVHRIMEIIKNIKHQEADIRNIIEDTRVVQREINTATEVLQRAHALVDDMVFREAKKDASMKDAYVQLTQLHNNFASLTQNVESLGRVQKEIRELEAKLEEMASRQMDVDQIMKDIEAVNVENQSLEAQIKQQRRK